MDSKGNTLDFMLSARRNKQAAKRFFKKVLKAKYNRQPRVINVDTDISRWRGNLAICVLKNAAYPPAIKELKSEKVLEEKSKIRQSKISQ